MTTTTERYTAEHIRVMAETYDAGAEDYHYSPLVSDVLHQAATDATRLQSLEAENARLLELVNTAEGIFQHCDVTDGMCVCGDDMKNHPSPMDCGHRPVDHGAYVVGQWLEHAHIARNALKEG
jgi:hypothetical protein